MLDKSNLIADLFPDRPVKPAKTVPEKEIDPDPMVGVCRKCGSPNLRGITVEDDEGKKVHTEQCKLCWHEGSPDMIKASEAVNQITRKRGTE